MRFAALLVAIFSIVAGIVGLTGAVRIAMGLVVILCAPASRAPKTLRALGAVMCMQALAAILLGPDRARAVLEWETMPGTALLRVGAAVASAAGGFVAFAVSGHRPNLKAKQSNDSSRAS